MPERIPVPPIPSIESIEYGRRVVGDFRSRMARFEDQAFKRNDRDAAEQWGTVVRLIDMFLLGDDDGGCVVQPFDQRWLDPGFRGHYKGACKLDQEMTP